MDNVQFETFDNADDSSSSSQSGSEAPRAVPTATEPIKLPGYGLSMDYLPRESRRFPILMGDSEEDWKARTLTNREVCMLRFMEDITNKPEWWRKVRDPAISSKWKKEVLQLNWTEYRKYGDFTPKMAVRCIEELRRKATLYEETGLIPVMDHGACVVKSDKLLASDLTGRLRTAVKRLEDVPEADKDWHPGSDEKVLDLVHPSLFPLVYGRSRIMRHQRIGVKECLDFCGRGFLIPRQVDEDTGRIPGESHHFMGDVMDHVSPNFQWLPCDVAVDGEGMAKIESYINNLHPKDHAELYPIIEEFIQKSLPAWDLIYRWVTKFQLQRITTRRVHRHAPLPDVADATPESGSPPPAANDGEGDDDALSEVIGEESEEDKRKYYRKDEDEEEDEADDADASGEDHYVESELASELELEPARAQFTLRPKNVKSSGFFNNAERVQVIVKLANIHLTPEKPSYDGGSWHVEGQLNEHICATALFYYDSDNITESRLAFRSPGNLENMQEWLAYEQNDRLAIEKVFAIRSGWDTMQDVGSVLTRPGRALFFPNLFQHRVQPFELQDPTRPGHRKILALFLVDPAIPVISTANVPPQQRHWYAGQSEAAATVLQNLSSIMDLDEAKRLREQLMAERTVLKESADKQLRQVEWNFCEH